MTWQKKARLAVALFGIACAATVYFAIGTRPTAVPLPALQRLDPKAILETTAGFLQQVRGIKPDYDIDFDRQLTYEDGSTRLVGVKIAVAKRDGRDFVVSAREAQAGRNQRDLQLTGDVRLAASDGFELTTDRAVFNQDDGVVHAAGTVTFGKGRMHGSGTGMTYDKNNDVLGITAQSRVVMTDDGGKTTMDFSAGASRLDRVQDILMLDGHVHVLRGEQVIDAVRATAHLSADDAFVTSIELRGESQVQGGGGTLETMSARDINLDYTSDGQTLERVVLTGDGHVALTGQDAAPGRRIAGDSLDLHLAPDGAVTQASGRDRVTLTLPESDGAPARSVSAAAFEATGAQGSGLTDARFDDRVEYREEGRTPDAARTVRSRTLRMGLEGDAISDAVFTGGVTFEEQGLTAGAATAQYQPDAGELQLSGSDAGGRPHVTDQQIAIEAGTIAVTLEGHRMTAIGSVQTRLRPVPASTEQQRAGGAAQAADAPSPHEARLPGLLRQDQPANVNAEALEYQGAGGSAIYTGNATLWQGETAIRGDVITIDQQKGDVFATGSARSTLALDGDNSVGRAARIRYEDARRVITYGPMPVTAPARPTAARTPGAAGGTGRVPAPPQAQLSGPQGELHADRIEVFLASAGSGVDRLEAYTNVALKLGMRTATGGRLTYHADSERYDMTGTAAAPVTVTEGCRQTSGRTLTFFKSTDRIVVDGNEVIRTQTQTTSGGPCAPPPQ